MSAQIKWNGWGKNTARVGLLELRTHKWLLGRNSPWAWTVDLMVDDSRIRLRDGGYSNHDRCKSNAAARKAAVVAAERWACDLIAAFPLEKK